MSIEQAIKMLHEIKTFYDSILSPKYRHADLNTLRQQFELLQGLKNDLGHDKAYQKLTNAMSQIIAQLERLNKLANMPNDRIWSNLSERGMNKVIPPILKRKGQTWPVEWTDKWENTCHINEGHWGAMNHIVKDVIGSMFLMKTGGDCLPMNAEPLFNDLFEIQQRENLLNGAQGNIIHTGNRHYIRFTDDDFRRFTGLRMNSTQIKTLLLETSRVEFKLTFPVRLKSTGSKENIHRMNYYSRLFEIGHEDLSIKSNGIVLTRRYTIVFNTLLGELFVNNLLAKYNDPIDIRFYLLPDSAQIFFRKALIHNNFKKIVFNIATIADYAGLTDNNPWNLATTVETNILEQLREYGYIDSYEKVGEDPKAPKYIIRRFGEDSNGNSGDVVGSVKDVAGSVKDVAGSVKRESR
jgi:hypothetical protein